jgi:hypothetical protein
MNRRNRKKRFTGQVSLMEEVKPKNIFETPQGDERLGWTGDAEIFCRTACFLENTYSFYRKWLRDVEADQTEEGGVAHVVPISFPETKGIIGSLSREVIRQQREDLKFREIQ